jgi:hypothetical protein
MQVEIRTGGDGVACWNVEAITAYATAINEREAALGEANPDLRITPGRVKCYGCEVLEFDMGVRCTAEVTKTLYYVEGEVAPRRADASAYLSEIPGLLTRIDAPGATSQPTTSQPTTSQPTTGQPATSQPEPRESRRGGLLGRLGRRP